VKRFRNFVLSLAVFALAIPLASAMDLIDIYQGLQTWSMRWGGYRTYRVPVKLASGRSCVIALSAHVNPKVDDYTLLLHGFGDSRFSWWKWVERYSNHPQYSSFVAVDLPQHGQTDCDSVDEWDEIVHVVHRALESFGRAPIKRIISQSLGVVPGALLAERYPDAQQVWLTPPFLNREPLEQLIADLLAINTPASVQTFMNRVLTKNRDFPEFLQKEMLQRIKNSQKILRKTSVANMDRRILARQYQNLLVVSGAKDQLVPPVELDPRVAQLTRRELAVVPCGHDILRHCGEDVKALVEQSRFRLDRARY
jgi:pimeloyl-ACP methyl ester carboxylesterase